MRSPVVSVAPSSSILATETPTRVSIPSAWSPSAMTGLALLLLAAQATAADVPEIAVEAGASEIFIGESVDYAVEIRDVKNPAPPDMS